MDKCEPVKDCIFVLAETGECANLVVGGLIAAGAIIGMLWIAWIS